MKRSTTYETTPAFGALFDVLRYWNSVQTGTYGTGMDRSFKMSLRFDL